MRCRHSRPRKGAEKTRKIDRQRRLISFEADVLRRRLLSRACGFHQWRESGGEKRLRLARDVEARVELLAQPLAYHHRDVQHRVAPIEAHPVAAIDVKKFS